MCANDGRIVTRRGAKEFSKWDKLNALKQRYDQSHSRRIEGAIVEEATTEERIWRVYAKESAARTTINMVFMIDVYIHAYDYLLSH
jgi:hypothetical protein